MRRLIRLGILLLVLAGIAGHVLYWYWPRERPGAPEAGGMPARLLASGQYGACLWVPFPHQNLGALAGSIDDGPEYVAAAARVAELPVPAIPSFGPFALPPSREIAACSDLDGRRFFLAARVYPGLAAVARLSGQLADNPWLKGGEVRETRGRRDEVEERVLHVAWKDGFWTVRSGPEPAPAEIPVERPAKPYPVNLGIFRLGQDVSDFPAGDYILRRKDDDLAVTLVGGEPAPEPPAAIVSGPDAPVLLAATGPAWPDDSPRPLPPAALALFDIKGGLNLGPLGQLPGAAVFNPPGGRRWALPGKGVAGLIARNLPRGNSAGWNVVALDAASLARAEALAPQISSLVPPAGDGTSGNTGGARLVLGLWVRPRPALGLVSQFRKGFEKVPLVDRRQVQSWRDWETLLRPLAACQRVSLSATRSPSAFLLRLEDCD
ncbi:MAG TPA: hypothetical protein VHC97_08755 [Thermoanaerobaculia bacterium]|jgi:hypothetical protein|nr:hypothetical protein [Thermoanaerobaculia bacterium]